MSIAPRLFCLLFLALLACRQDERRPVLLVAEPATGAAFPAAPAPAPVPVSPPAHVVLEYDLAAQHAPDFYQDVASRHGGLADLPLRIDFDGDWDGLNNWESLDAAASGALPAADLRAYVYYSVVESETHYFIGYFVYHPQDWENLIVARSFGQHEHDLEGLMVCVAKDRQLPYGDLVAMETQAHRDVYQYAAHPGVQGKTETIDGPVHFRAGAGLHPRVFQQAKGHGLYASSHVLSGSIYLGLPGTDFPGGDGYVFSHARGAAQYALDANLGRDARDGRRDDAQRRVSYELLPIDTELWPRRHAGPSTIFATAWDYVGRRYALPGLTRTFQGDTHKRNASVTPWAHGDRNDGLARGEWFLDPALAWDLHLALPGPYSQRYRRNVYLGIP